MKRLLVLPVLLAVILLTPRAARAQTSQNDLTVTANVIPTCTIDAAALAFGAYDANVDRDASTQITVRCTQGASFWVGLGAGLYNSGASRQMANGAERLAYELYRSAPPAAVWDNADPGLAQHIAAGNAGYSPYLVDLYGRIPAGQFVPAGNYSDTVQMTVNF